MTYYMATTVMAVILGIILVTAIHPGVPAHSDTDIPKVNLHDLAD